MSEPLDPAAWAEVERLFAELADRPAEERSALLDAGEPAPSVRREVEELLAHADPPGEGPVAAAADEAARGRAALIDAAGGTAAGATAEGTRVGRYRLVREVGRGGMGVVYLARREGDGIEQRVAVKLLPGALFDGDMERRFRQERRILATLEHPGIARFLDGGTTDAGVPWVAMEFVDGEPVDAWVDARNPGRRERLELFLRVCGAVSHAHRKLVVHRDLKPANILVDAEGRPRLLDFGIARLVEADDDGGGRTVTRMMTPRFASPEQISGRPVGTPADVYALGALLHLLLTGVKIHADVSSASELARRVVETDPVPPSRAAGDPSLAGDLDTIVVTALRRDPEERYPSVDALAADVRAYLASEPIAARPSTWTYRTRKFVARHRGVVAAAAVAAVAVLAGSVAATAGFVQARRAEADAVQEARVADRVSDFLVSLFETVDPDVTGGQERTARELLDEGLERIGDGLGEEPAVQARLLEVMAKSYASIGLYETADSVVARALALEGGSPELRARLLATRGQLLYRVGDYDDATAWVDSTLAFVASRIDTAGGLEPHLGSPYGDAYVSALADGALVLAYRGDTAAAVPRAERAYRLGVATAGEGTPARHQITEKLAMVYSEANRQAEAIDLYEALARDYVHREDGDSWRISARKNLAIAYARAGQYERAAATLDSVRALEEEVYGPEHPNTIHSVTTLGTLYVDMGRPEQGEPLLRDALAREIARFGPYNDRVSMILNNLALVLQRRDDWAGAEGLFQRAADIRRTTVGPDSPRYGSVVLGVGNARRNQGDWAGAAEAYAEGVRVFRALGPVPPVVLRDYAEVLRSLGRHDEARAVEAEAHENESDEETAGAAEAAAADGSAGA